MTNNLFNEQDHKDNTIPAFGYELIRETVLNDILGKDSKSILYWAGKDLARKYPLTSINDIIAFFENAGWGQLVIKKQTKSKLDFELTSNLITKRIEANKDCHFQLEAGFLAEQIKMQTGYITETFEHPKKRRGLVYFTVQSDNNDTV